MKTTIIMMLSLMINFLNAQEHHHQTDHLPKADKKTTNTKQFVSTNDLKLRMEKILILANESSRKKDDIKSVQEYGVKITETLNDIFKTCKLEPDADVAIHPLLALIFEGAKDFKNGQYQGGYKKIHEALLGYSQLFKHEGWKY